MTERNKLAAKIVNHYRKNPFSHESIWFENYSLVCRGRIEAALTFVDSGLIPESLVESRTLKGHPLLGEYEEGMSKLEDSRSFHASSAPPANPSLGAR